MTEDDPLREQVRQIVASHVWDSEPYDLIDSLAEFIHELMATGETQQDSLLEAAYTGAARAEKWDRLLADLRTLADQWNTTPDYQPTHYDRGRVDQRHDMTGQLLELLARHEPE
jgi:hypothetical protein